MLFKRGLSRRLIPMALLCLGLSPAVTWAGPLTYTVSGTSSGGSGQVSAQAVFTAGNGFIQVDVTNFAVASNLAKGITPNAGQAVSALHVSFGNGLSLPTLFTEVKGSTITFPGTTTSPADVKYPGTGVDSLDHWGFTTSGTTAQLDDVNNPLVGGNPQYMIKYSGANITSGGSNLDPFFIGTNTKFKKKT
jgi:hypothetical protein